MICYQFNPISLKGLLNMAEYSLPSDSSGIIFSLYLDNEIFGHVTQFTTIAQSNDH